MRRRTWPTVLALCLVIGAMTITVSYSVTLYRLFCEATGAGGTTRRVASDDAAIAADTVTVAFDTSVAPGMNWSFHPMQPEVTLHLGESQVVFFEARNDTGETAAGHATFNVTPDAAGFYFKKIQCFCFDEERLAAHASVQMPVEFFVDPAFAHDPDTKGVRRITLSYTFFPSRKPDTARDLARFDAPDPSMGARLFATDCAGCHDATRNKVGPALAGVVGRRAGGTAYPGYSPALASSGIVWTEALLDAWLAGPQALVPGTRMPAHVDDAAGRRDIIAYLAGLRPAPGEGRAVAD